MDCCRALTFASARLSCSTCHISALLQDGSKKFPVYSGGYFNKVGPFFKKSFHFYSYTQRKFAIKRLHRGPYTDCWSL